MNFEGHWVKINNEQRWICVQGNQEGRVIYSAGERKESQKGPKLFNNFCALPLESFKRRFPEIELK